MFLTTSAFIPLPTDICRAPQSSSLAQSGEIQEPMYLATRGSSADGSLPGQCQVGWDFPHCGQWEEGRQVGMGC